MIQLFWYMSNLLKIEEFDDWRDMVEIFDSLKNDDKFIYRGQSNLYDFKSDNFYTWDIVSSFNRFYPEGAKTYKFDTYLQQQFQSKLFSNTYKDYYFVQKNNIVNYTYLQRVYFFQHYGIPTCFIDFTFNPLIALYFAISSVKTSSGGALDENNNLVLYPQDCYLSVFRINKNDLIRIFNIKKINQSDFPFHYYKYYVNSILNCYIGIDFEPYSGKKNFNLEKQMSCFVLFDNNGLDIGLVKFLDHIKRCLKISIQEPLIVEYRLKYNAILKRFSSVPPQNMGLFTYLSRKKVSGKYLFDDIQGLKYDFNFFHH